jgi:hypothetical protein
MHWEQLARWKNETRKNPSLLLKWFCSRRLKRAKSEESGKKKTSQKRPQKLGTYPRRSFRAAAPVWQSAEEAEMLKTSRWNLQMRGGSSSEMLPKEIKQQQQSRPYH